MNAFFAVYIKELRSLFSSFIAYAVMAGFLVLSGLFFYYGIAQSGQADMTPMWGNIIVTLLFIMPLYSMRLLSEEKKSGTLELLLTRPVTEGQIVLGKYFSVLTAFLILLLPLATYAVILTRLSDVAWPVLASQFLAVFLVGATFLAIGTFASSLTENQIVAAVLAFVITLVLWLVSWFTVGAGPNSLINYLNLSGHFEDMLRGVIDARDVVFYLSYIVLFLFLTIRVLDMRRWY